MASPPTPAYIFRGHNSSINAVKFFDNDQYIASCDANGVVCIWRMKTRRSILEWKAHEHGCLQVHVYDSNKLISQGRDNVVHIWQLLLDNSDKLKCEATLIHSIPYYSLSFCRSSICQTSDDTLLCLPLRGHTSLVDIYSIQQQKWIVQKIGVAKDSNEKDDRLCMAVQLFWPGEGSTLFVLVGYEDGSVALWNVSDLNEKPNLVWKAKEHTAPVLDVAVDRTAYAFAVSTSADNQIVKYALSSPLSSSQRSDDNPVIKKSSIKKSGLAAVDIRRDGKIFATAGHDGRIRVFSCKSLQPLAILSYHRDSVYTVAFASTLQDSSDHWLIGGSKEARISLWSIY
ncbi:WD40-repeat-containing domain protein [Zychaea mexicana]|uniref:WD40-repeat-containing domain protein n=1 Tax=Zychaea mexicana TaxID=64656 RepID=UPI0022FEABE9|nr:WD40-repeat-containing domain protein [Zychaea mexicana]KAI9495068.1 WD40-repeat-containing domain protein [Zychaea mexicana]